VSALLFAAWCAIATLLLFVVPGLVASQVVFAQPTERGPEVGLLFAAAWGFGLVPTAAFFVHLATGLRVSAGLVGAVAALHVVGAVIVDRRRRRAGAPAGWSWWTASVRRDLDRSVLAVLAVSLLLGVGGVLRYSDAALPPENSCIYSAALTATGHRDEGVDLLRQNVEDARLGNTGVIAGFLAVYRGAAYRALHGVCALLLALGGFALGRLVGGSVLWGWAGLALLTLNPYVLSIPQPDENLIALAWATPALVLLALKRPPWLAAGALLGLALTMRHVLVLGAPAAFLVAGMDPQRRRAVGLLALGLLSTTAMEHLHHLLALGSVFRFESNAQFPVFDYELLGLSFRWEGMVNWPLHDTLVRTPHNPLPMAVAWPLHVADRFGLILAAAGLVGAVGSWWVDRRLAALLMVWFVPTYTMLALQEAWDFPNKMGVLLILLTPVVAWVLLGLAAGVRRPAVEGVAIALLAGAGTLAAPTLSERAVPADERYLAWFDETADESAELRAREAQVAVRLGMLPDYGRVGEHGPLLEPGVFGAVADLFADPTVRTDLTPWGWAPAEVPARGGPVTLEIDLSSLPEGIITVRPTDEAPDLDLATDAGSLALHRASGVAVPWDRRPLVAYGLVGSEVTTIAFAFTRPVDAANGPCHCAWRDGNFLAPCGGRCSLLADLTGVHVSEQWTSPGEREVVHVGRNVVRVRVPAGGINIALFQIPFANRFLLWRVRATPEGAVVDGPWRPWHS
jgi:hypothetical protein